MFREFAEHPWPLSPITQLRAAHTSKVEAERISRILHDEVGQVVSAVGLKLELLRMDCEKLTPEAAERVASIQRLLETAMVPLRRLISELATEPRTVSGQPREEVALK